MEQRSDLEFAGAGAPGVERHERAEVGKVRAVRRLGDRAATADHQWLRNSGLFGHGAQTPPFDPKAERNAMFEPTAEGRAEAPRASANSEVQTSPIVVELFGAGKRPEIKGWRILVSQVDQVYSS